MFLYRLFCPSPHCAGFPTGALFSSTLDQHLQSPTVPISASLYCPLPLFPASSSLTSLSSSFSLYFKISLRPENQSLTFSLLREPTGEFCYPTCFCYVKLQTSAIIKSNFYLSNTVMVWGFRLLTSCFILQVLPSYVQGFALHVLSLSL